MLTTDTWYDLVGCLALREHTSAAGLLTAFPSSFQVTENQQGTDGARPADTAAGVPQTAAQQAASAAAAALPAAGAAPAAEPPEEEKFTVHVPEGLTYFDLDLIKMTAQFVARNGKGFLTGIFCQHWLGKQHACHHQLACGFHCFHRITAITTQPMHSSIQVNITVVSQHISTSARGHTCGPSTKGRNQLGSWPICSLLIVVAAWQASPPSAAICKATLTHTHHMHALRCCSI